MATILPTPRPALILVLLCLAVYTASAADFEITRRNKAEGVKRGVAGRKLLADADVDVGVGGGDLLAVPINVDINAGGRKLQEVEGEISVLGGDVLGVVVDPSNLDIGRKLQQDGETVDVLGGEGIINIDVAGIDIGAGKLQEDAGDSVDADLNSQDLALKLAADPGLRKLQQDHEGVAHAIVSTGSDWSSGGLDVQLGASI